MRSYDATTGNIAGTAAQLVTEDGFVPGAYVVRKKDKVTAVIQHFDKEMVILRVIGEGHCSSGRVKVHYNSFLKKEWTKYTPKANDQAVDGEYFPWDHVDYKTMMVKAKVAMQMHHVYTSAKEPGVGLKVFFKPKYVVCNKDFKKNELVLIPSTTKIVAMDETKDYPPNSIPLGRLQEGLKYYLLPWTQLPKEDGKQPVVNPFFFVNSSDDCSECNMELVPSTLNKYSCSGDNLVVKIPTMKNTRALKCGETLTVYKAKVDKVVDLEELVPADDDDQQPTQKRRRVKGSWTKTFV